MRAFGKYQLLATLGRGGMADVYLAVVRGPQGFTKLVVIKKLRTELAEEEGFRTMLADEARLAARLSHPNVVQTYEVGEHGREQFIAMEYLDGQPLQRLVSRLKSRKEPLEAAFAARIVADSLAGLHYAHELRDYDGSHLAVIHRDVSPHNIFVTYEGEVKLVDFGIAKATLGSAGTEVGVLKGKFAYMAPEQAEAKDVDRRVDVFAAGVVLWELLAGKRLFRGDTTAATLRNLLHEDLPPLLSARPDADPKLAAICGRALEKDRNRRYATADAMRTDLEAWLAAQPRRVGRDEVAALIRTAFDADRQEAQEQIKRFMAAGGEPPSSRRGSGDEADDEPTRSLPRMRVPSPDSTSTGVAASLFSPANTATTAASPAAVRVSGRKRAAMIGGAVLAVLGVLVGGLVVGQAVGRRGAAAATLPLPAPSASASAAPEVVTLRLCGSNTIGAELGPALVEAYLKRLGGADIVRQPGAKPHHTRVLAKVAGKNAPTLVEVEAEGSATAFEGLLGDRCDLGMSSRPINDEEHRKLMERGLGDLRLPASEHVVALDGIAVIVNLNNPLKALDLDKIGKIFSGEATDWSAVGGAAGPIRVLARDDNSGTFDTFKHLVLGKRKLVPTAARFEGSDQLSDAVAGDPTAIGFIGLAYVRSAKALAVQPDATSLALVPSAFTVTTEGYVLSRRLYLYSAAQPKNKASTDFVSFALSAEGQRVVRAAGFVDLSVGMQEAEAGCDRCSPRYARTVKGGRRLSLDFRFRRGSNELDSRAARDLERLVVFLRAHTSERLVLIGFSDGSGAAATNLNLSRERAQAVATELTARGVKPSVVDGFGAEMPVASNEDENGRQKNRRVEVWLAPE